MRHLALASAMLASILPAQLGARVGPIIDVASTVNVALGLANAGSFRGICRDGAGNFWVGSTNPAPLGLLLIRIDQTGQVSGFATIPRWIPTGSGIRDITFDDLVGRIWILEGGSSSFQVGWLDIATAQYTFLGGRSNPGTSIAFERSSNSLLVGTSASRSGIERYDIQAGAWSTASTLAVSNPIMVLPSSTGGVWIQQNGGCSPSSRITNSTIEEVNLSAANGAGPVMVPDLGIGNGATRGGTPGGIDAWQDQATGDWLAVVMQLTDNGGAFAYMARMESVIGPGCGGRFSRGPCIAQTDVFASYEGPGSLAWMVVSFGTGSVTVPQLPMGCQFHLDPTLAIVFGPGIVNPSMRASVSVTIPRTPAFFDQPLFFQWAAAGFLGFTVTEARVVAVKQF